MAFSTTLYNTVFKRNSIYLSTIFLGAFGFQIVYDVGTSRFWDKMNAGKQWKDIRHRYVEEEDEE
ncbi:ubiquinol-cytochrome C reductase [Saitoella complicata NRRL Y-17804]|uniref:ubiquinol-cytochrome C reductase n=1 Tax=Saitoella complicata (strain BCRC 22490 / CBS 7301 / JCM 7358 / NBRC 10748 / NRRL Y-17804) TaxID=698492 RepID=UPI000867A0F2|nr:ubiquinol-cytochrome C reductase [Saitoella complicata NRRL Y-17804]ODQ49999.1 ubiquinol-cytochrome C reductase [Saitoella complicata NRRL Y-17804]